MIAIYAGTLYPRCFPLPSTTSPILPVTLPMVFTPSSPLYSSLPCTLPHSAPLPHDLPLTVPHSPPSLPHPLRQVHTPQDHDRRTTTPYRRCTPARTSPNQQIYPALYRRPRPLYDTSGLLPRTLAGFNQGRRKKISREIRYFWVSLCSLYSVFFFLLFCFNSSHILLRRLL